MKTRTMKFEDITIGDELPIAVKTPTSMEVVKFAAATDDYYQVHYDKDFAVERGLPGVIIQGGLGLSYLAQMVNDWMGPNGAIVSLSGSYRGINPVNEELFCHGSVKRKYREAGKKRVELELRIENAAGEETITGSAIIAVNE